MADEERTGTCLICQRRDPLPELQPVCGPCRSRGRGHLQEIPVLVDELHGDTTVDATTGAELVEVHADHLVDVGDRLAAVVRVEHRHLVDVHAGAVPGRSGAPRVSASHEAPVPISVDRVDLLAAARSSTSSSRDLAYPEQDDDQIGYLSAATILDGWCRDWATGRRETPPDPVPSIQCSWLLDRWDWACAEHPAVDEFAGELGDLWRALRRLAGLTEPQPELCVGVPCSRADCDVKTLWRVPGSAYVECGSCGALLTETEYQAWCKLLVAAAKRERS